MATARQIDPTHTLTIRRSFMSEASRRWRAVASAVRKALIDRHVLGLTANADLPPERAFAFESDPRKVDDFMNWLDEMVDDEILEVTEGPITGGQPWSNKYIRRAYGRGTEDAWMAMKKADLVDPDEAFDLEAAFRQPFHADRAALLYQRTYSEIKGATEAMKTALHRELTQGISEGDGPRSIARKLKDVFEGKAGRQRALTIARTETIRAHAEASLNSYEQVGLQDVQVEAEWSTAGDDRVCELCLPLDGVVMPIKEARGLLPRHPNCRCAWLPATVNAKEPTQKRGKTAEKAVAKSASRSAQPWAGAL